MPSTCFHCLISHRKIKISRIVLDIFLCNEYSSVSLIFNISAVFITPDKLNLNCNQWIDEADYRDRNHICRKKMNIEEIESGSACNHRDI
jgi:hypothetical protein